MGPSVMKTLPAGKFKAQCLAILEEVQTKRQSVVITKRGKPVAKLVPVREGSEETDDIFGFFKGEVEINGDIVAPASTPEEWGELYFDPASEVAEKKKS